MPSQTELDWTIDEAPSTGEAQAPPPPGAPAPRPERRWPWRALAALAALLAAGGLAAFLYVRGGWERIEQQLAREAAYEDAQSRAGAVALVEAVQARDSAAWLERRAAEAALGLPAALPAQHLLPAEEEPQLEDVTAVGQGVYTATVVRAYTDSASQRLEYAVVQRYRSLGPGLWERLPPEETPPDDYTNWLSPHLSATLPRRDLPLLADLLPQVDAALAAVCAEWDCAEAAGRVPLVFVGDLAGLPPPGLPARASAGEHGPYPAIFDAALVARESVDAVVLPAPHLAGLPRGEAAEAALVHAYTAQALLFLADSLAGYAAPADDFFRDALIARAEIRLGLAPAPGYAPSAGDYTPLDNLWVTPRAAEAPDVPAQLAHRLQALAFLDFALAGQTAEVEATLLRTLRWPELVSWLGTALGPAAADLALDWENAQLAQSGTSLAMDRFDGLAYGCQENVWLLRGGQLDRVNTGGAWLRPDPNGLSADGRYLAYVTDTTTEWPALNVLDLHTGVSRTADHAPSFMLAGWAADGALIYLRESDYRPDLYLTRYEPGTGRIDELVSVPVLTLGFDHAGSWSADRTALGVVLNLTPNRTEGPPDAGTAWALASVLEAGRVNRIVRSGPVAMQSPDGRLLAYVKPLDSAGEEVVYGLLVLYDLEARRPVVRLDTAPFTREGGQPPWLLLPLGWMPKGERLVVAAMPFDGTVGIYTVTRAGEVASVAPALPESVSPATRLSADGRYMALFASDGEGSGLERRLAILDLLTGEQREVLSGRLTGAAWSPEGQLLAVSTRGGVVVVDAATGEQRWLTFRDCSRVTWYDLEPAAGAR